MIKFTESLSALRRKNALQLSHVIASKLYPSAGEPQTTHVNEPFFALFGFDDCISSFNYRKKYFF
jgi:hypothetical protein